MLEAFILLLLVLIWLNLYQKMNTSESKTDRLLKEVEELKKKLADSSLHIPEVEEVSKIPAIDNTVEEPIAESCVQHSEKPVLQEAPPPPPVGIFSEIVPPPPPSPSIVSPQATRRRENRKNVNYEKYIGENLFGKIGILILVMGMGLFVKYAIDKNWINETLRTVMGFAVGGILLFLSARLKTAYRTFSSLLAGGAFAIFYVTVAIAYQYYGLFSQTLAFSLLVVFTISMTALSLWSGRRELAAIALVGGFIAPFLVSDGSGNLVVLFTYVIVLDLGMFVLSIYKKWGELPVICFVLTWLVLGGYAVAADLDVMRREKLGQLLAFSTAFYLLFVLSAVWIVRINTRTINQLLFGVLTLNNFVFLFFALWFVREMQWETNYNGVLTLFVAIVNLLLFWWMRHKGERLQFLVHTLLWIGIAFISVTIPVQLKGTFITLFWATEMVIILHFYTRFRMPLYEFFGICLAVLTFLSYKMDLENAYSHFYLSEENRLFLNGTFATGIYTGLAFGVGAWLWKRAGRNNKWLIAATSVVLYTAFMMDFWLYIRPSIDAISCMTVFTIAVLVGMTAGFGAKRFPLAEHVGWYLWGAGISIVWYIGFSLLLRWYSFIDTLPKASLWIAFILLIGHLVVVGRFYYKKVEAHAPQANEVTCWLGIFAAILLVIGTNNLLYQNGLTEEMNAGFSISLSVAGFLQMALGMRLHLKVLRGMSLVIFGLVLLKLVAIDLWLLPTIGKVIIFIILGVLLLVLSFLYQKLKAVLFDDDRGDANG